MSKPVIAVDIDDVLAAHADEVVAFSNKHFGTHLTVQDYREHWSEMWLISHEETERRAALWRTPERVKDFKKLADRDIDTVLSRLRQRYDLAIVTARPSIWHDDTLAWVEKHYPGVFREVRLVPTWTNETQQTKAEVCKEIGARYLIDDSVGHCNTAAEAGMGAILFEAYPWNKNRPIDSSVVRVKNWQEIWEYFDGQDG